MTAVNTIDDETPLVEPSGFTSGVFQFRVAHERTRERFSGSFGLPDDVIGRSIASERRRVFVILGNAVCDHLFRSFDSFKRSAPDSIARKPGKESPADRTGVAIQTISADPVPANRNTEV